jgi:membrane-associated phospholipid phosphatase
MRIKQTENRSLWVFTAILLSIGCFLLTTIEKGDLIVYFSGHRKDYANLFFKVGSFIGEGWAYAFFILWMLRISYAKAATLLSLAVLVPITAKILKVYFAHPRPFIYFRDIVHRLQEITYVEGVEVNSSHHSSFPSGHTMAGFALYFMLALFCKKTWQKLLCLGIAAWVGIARIYLVQHFLEDVIAGASVGILLTLLASVLYNRMLIPRLGDRHWAMRVSDV